MSAPFEHLRHKPASPLSRPRELIVATPQLQSQVNLSRIVRAAGCCGVSKVIACGNARLDRKIARDGADATQLEVHRTLPPVLQEYRRLGWPVIALEQTTNSQSLYEFRFPRQCLLVLGHERNGLTPEELQYVDAVVEIPVYGLPFSHNVATAAAIAMYEYCRQYPEG